MVGCVIVILLYVRSDTQNIEVYRRMICFIMLLFIFLGAMCHVVSNLATSFHLVRFLVSHSQLATFFTSFPSNTIAVRTCTSELHAARQVAGRRTCELGAVHSILGLGGTESTCTTQPDSGARDMMDGRASHPDRINQRRRVPTHARPRSVRWRESPAGAAGHAPRAPSPAVCRR